MNDNEKLNYSIEAIKGYTQMTSIFKLEQFKKPENIMLNRIMRKEYGLERCDLLASFIELFYQKGKEDALRNLKDNL